MRISLLAILVFALSAQAYAENNFNPNLTEIRASQPCGAYLASKTFWMNTETYYREHQDEIRTALHSAKYTLGAAAVGHFIFSAIEYGKSGVVGAQRSRLASMVLAVSKAGERARAQAQMDMAMREKMAELASGAGRLALRGVGFAALATVASILENMIVPDGVGADSIELKMDEAIKDPGMLYHLSDDEACELLWTSPDALKAFQRMQNQAEQAYREARGGSELVASCRL
jgi:hypothetical protein